MSDERLREEPGSGMSEHRAVLVFVGGGPRTVSLLERISANAPELLPPSGLEIHVVDPYPVGGGRIWRRNQSPLLWMNSVARDVTIFTDESVVCEGPIVPGPPLDKWVAGPGRQVLIDAGMGEQADAFAPDDFASREVQSLYLSWTFDQVRAALPDSVRVITHRQRAVRVSGESEPGTRRPGEVAARQQIELEDGTVLGADIVVLAQGYLDRVATEAEAELISQARENGLTYVPPGYTADVDLSGLRPGSSVLVRGFGLAFIDLMVLVFEGRGGRFDTAPGGELVYAAAGDEPVLHVGSRRGVPYHAKLGYTLGSAAPVPPVYFTPAAVAALGSPDRPADFRTELWPLIVKELTGAHYRRLFEFHADRTARPWNEISSALARLDVADQEFRELVEVAVPDPRDRFDIAAVDRPLRGRVFGSRETLSRALVDYITDDLARRADPDHSADHAVFNALLTVYGVLAAAIVTGRVSAHDRVRYLEGEFHGLFSFLASGPPPRRLAELLALHRAGLVRFAGPDLRVTVRNGRFVGSSPAVADEIDADALVDARLPRPDVRAASDPVIAGLLSAGELAAEDLVAADGSSLGAGQLLADADCRAVRADRSVHPARFLLGPSVSGSAGSAGFSRPGFNGPGFRQNDRVARELLRLAGESAQSTGSLTNRCTSDPQQTSGPVLARGPEQTHGYRAGGPDQAHPAGPITKTRPAPVRPVAPGPPVHSTHIRSPQERIETSHAR